eukprot:jgi/Hompol1/3832/HPOL_006769-RA
MPSAVSLFQGFENISNPLGKVAIDSNGDPIAPYNIFNVQTINGTGVLVGVWSGITDSITSVSSMVFASGSSTPPLDSINPLDYTYIVGASDWEGIIALILNVVLAIVTVVLFVYHLTNSEDRNLKASSIESQLIVLSGMFLACTDVLTMIG